MPRLRNWRRNYDNYVNTPKSCRACRSITIYIGMAYMGMANIVMAYTVMAHIVMLREHTEVMSGLQAMAEH